MHANIKAIKSCSAFISILSIQLFYPPAQAPGSHQFCEDVHKIALIMLHQGSQTDRWIAKNFPKFNFRVFYCSTVWMDHLQPISYALILFRMSHSWQMHRNSTHIAVFARPQRIERSFPKFKISRHNEVARRLSKSKQTSRTEIRTDRTDLIVTN